MSLPLPLPHPITDGLVVLIAHRVHPLGQPMRLRLRDGEATAQELADELAGLVGDFADRPSALTPQRVE